MAVRVGFGTRVPPENAQVTDFTKQQKRQNRSFRRFGVRRGYTGYEVFSSEKLLASRAGGESVKPIRAGAYLRVSTASKTKRGETSAFDQDPAVQERPLRDLVAQRGWTLYRLYSDRASGAKERRPGLDALMADARRGLLDVVVVFRFDRFARSAKR